MKASDQLLAIAKVLNEENVHYFNEQLNYDWKKYKSIGDIRNLYPIESNMLNIYKEDEVFQNAYKNGFLIFDQKGKLIAIHSKETFEHNLQPQKCNQDEILVIGRFNDCYPISKEIFQQRYIHIEGSKYQKKSNIVIYAIQNPYDYEILVKNQHGDLKCKIGDYITKNNNSYAVVDKQIFEETYSEVQNE